MYLEFFMSHIHTHTPIYTFLAKLLHATHLLNQLLKPVTHIR